MDHFEIKFDHFESFHEPTSTLWATKSSKLRIWHRPLWNPPFFKKEKGHPWAPANFKFPKNIPLLGRMPPLLGRMPPLLGRMPPLLGRMPPCLGGRPLKTTIFQGPKWFKVLGGVGFALWALLGTLKIPVYRLKSTIFNITDHYEAKIGHFQAKTDQNWLFWNLPRANFGLLNHEKLQIQDLAPAPIKPSLFKEGKGGIRGPLQISNFRGTFRMPPAWEDAPPAWEDAPPAWEDAPPAWEDAPPAWEDAPAAWEDAPPAWEDAPPAWEDAP